MFFNCTELRKYFLFTGSSSHELPVILPPNPVNTTVRRGEKSSLLCSVRSMEAPTIKWIKKLDQANVDSFKGKWPNNSLKIDEKLYLILPPQQVGLDRYELTLGEVFFFILFTLLIACAMNRCSYF